MTENEQIEILQRLNMFNEENKVKPGHKTFVHINSVEYYNVPAENGAVCALHFTENTFNRQFDSKFEFTSEENLLNYLRAHTNM